MMRISRLALRVGGIVGRAAPLAGTAFSRLVLGYCWGKQIVMGSRVCLGADVDIRIEGDGLLELGDDVQLTRTAITVCAGARVTIGSNAKISGLRLHATSGWFESDPGLNVNTIYPDCTTHFWIREGTAKLGKSVLIDGGMFRVLNSGRLEVGDYSGIGRDSEIRAEMSVRIGQYTMIAHRVSIFDTNTHSLDYRERRDEVHQYPADRRGNVKRSPVDIGDDCWVGLASAVLKGTLVGARSVIGMNTVVTAGHYPPDSIIVGNEVRVIPRAEGAGDPGHDYQASILSPAASPSGKS
jgi:acetyltransferase-like isoleucine patch superfamily enzyme